MDNKMTEISQEMYEEATAERLTGQDAVEYLEKEGKGARSGKSWRNILTAGICSRF